jgi:putative NADPH-quinone reductase
MRANVILAHPWKKSFNHGLFERVLGTFSALGVEARGHDLYAEGFDPVMTTAELGKEPSLDPLVRRYVTDLVDSDYLVFIHPNWWGQPPAILKGYIDRVIRPPHAYDIVQDPAGHGRPVGRLGSKAALVLNTSNTDEEREANYFHDPLEYEWGRCVFGFCGIERWSRRMFRVVEESGIEERKAWLDEAAAMVETLVRGGSAPR